MNFNDFSYMRRGRSLSPLTPKDEIHLRAVDRRGSGKDSALLLLHGFSSSPAVYRYLVPQITSYDALICPPLPGHADSIAAFSLSTAHEWRESAYKACEALMKEYQHVHVLGLSLGGLLACELSQQFDLTHLFLLAPALKLKMNLARMLKLALCLKFFGIKQLPNAAGNILSDDYSEISYKKLPMNSIIEMLTLAKNYKWIPPTCPTDVFLGAHDAVVASNDVKHLFSAIPNATVHWLENSAHVLPLDNDLEEIVDCINSK